MARDLTQVLGVVLFGRIGLYGLLFSEVGIGRTVQEVGLG